MYSSSYNCVQEYISECGSVASHPSLSSEGPALKKKTPMYSDAAHNDEEANSFKSVKSSAEWNKRQNHSEIEKRRRDKMNTYISELSHMIPQCRSRKLDKLSVLRMAALHIKNLRGFLNSYTQGPYKPSFLSDQEVHNLLLQNSGNSFLIVVGCDRGKILYVSESIASTLQYTPQELLGTCIFDVLHPKDLNKVKEQISCNDVARRDRLVDAKTLLPVDHKNNNSFGSVGQEMCRLSPGSRRAFFCRMKKPSNFITTGDVSSNNVDRTGAYFNEYFQGMNGCNYVSQQNVTPTSTNNATFCTGKDLELSLYPDISDPSQCNPSASTSHRARGVDTQSGANSISCDPLINDKKFIEVHLTGYVKCWSNSLHEFEEDTNDGNSGNMTCLVAIGRTLHQKQQTVACVQQEPLYFVSKLTTDFKFSYIDQKGSLALGWLPQELHGYNIYHLLVHQEDGERIATAHRALVTGASASTSLSYSIKHKDGSSVRLESEWTLFRSPWTQEVEFIIMKNSVVNLVEERINSSSGSCPSGSLAFQDGTVNRLVTSKANAAVDNQAIQTSSCSVGAAGLTSLRVSNTKSDSEASTQAETTTDSDEAAMAVIMSLLEADAGLGGPVDFSHLPWPLS